MARRGFAQQDLVSKYTLLRGHARSNEQNDWHRLARTSQKAEVLSKEFAPRTRERASPTTFPGMRWALNQVHETLRCSCAWLSGLIGASIAFSYPLGLGCFGFDRCIPAASFLASAWHDFPFAGQFEMASLLPISMATCASIRFIQLG